MPPSINQINPIKSKSTGEDSEKGKKEGISRNERRSGTNGWLLRFPFPHTTFPTSTRYTAVPYSRHGPIRYSVHHRAHAFLSTVALIWHVLWKKKKINCVYCISIHGVCILLYFIVTLRELGSSCIILTRICRLRVWGIIKQKRKKEKKTDLISVWIAY